MTAARVLIAVASGLLSAGCAGFMSGGSDMTEERFRSGTAALEYGEFERARTALTEVAARCEAGEHGRAALLLLSTVDLDARNPDADPTRAASYARSYLMLPAAPADEQALARTLYLLAIDRGAREDPDAELGTASRFSDCDAPPRPADWTGLPVHPGPRTAFVLDSLRSERDRLRGRANTLADSLRAVRTRESELEAEIERIRKLLSGGGGGTGAPGPR